MVGRMRIGMALVVLATTAAVGIGTGAPAGAVPAVTVTPSTGLLDGHVVAVEGTGLPPGGPYLVTQCDGSGDCAGWSGETPIIPPNVALVEQVGDDGAFAVRLQLSRGSCNEPGECTAEVHTIDPSAGPLAVAPLTFAAEGTYQWPQAELDPTFPDHVLEGADVAVEVAGMSPWVRIGPNFPPVASIDVCRDEDPIVPGHCRRGVDVIDDLRLDYAAIAGDGSGAGGFALPRYLPGAPDWDCAVQGCVLVVTQGGTLQTLGNPVTQAVPIEYAPEWAPWGSAEEWVDEVYEPLTGVTYGPADTATIAADLASREQTAVRLMALGAGAAATPGAERIREVVSLYRAFFGRTPETGGLGYWLERRRTGTTVSAIARAFGGTPEFRAQYDGVSNGTVVDRAYRNTLGRDPDAAGRAYWVGRLEQGMARSTLLHHFSRSPEMRNRLADTFALTRITWTLLGRAPERAEVEAVVADPGYRAGGPGLHTVIAELLVSGDLPAG